MSNPGVAPKIPFGLFSSITVIDSSTPVVQARLWQSEMESAYNRYFADPEPNWTWDDVHDCDRDVLVELEEVVRASHQPPMDLDLVSSFSSPDWRAPYLKQLFAEYSGEAALGWWTAVDVIPLEEQIQWQRARGIQSCDGDLSADDEALLFADWLSAQAIYQSKQVERI
jgi:hypothetical protein